MHFNPFRKKTGLKRKPKPVITESNKRFFELTGLKYGTEAKPSIREWNKPPFELIKVRYGNYSLRIHEMNYSKERPYFSKTDKVVYLILDSKKENQEK
jgi:hypothetical protein